LHRLRLVIADDLQLALARLLRSDGRLKRLLDETRQQGVDALKRRNYTALGDAIIREHAILAAATINT
jgi:hypothetical protein